MNNLHPIFHGHAYQVGSRIDIERVLPCDLADEDCDLMLEDHSEPPRFIERVAPVSTRIGNETVRGGNWTELMIKTLRVFNRVLAKIAISIHQSVKVQFRQRGMVPFMSIDFGPDALHRIIEMDNETNENTYGRIMDFFAKGVLSPVVTLPFHILLPTIDDEFQLRTLTRISDHDKAGLLTSPEISSLERSNLLTGV